MAPSKDMKLRQRWMESLQYSDVLCASCILCRKAYCVRFRGRVKRFFLYKFASVLRFLRASELHARCRLPCPMTMRSLPDRSVHHHCILSQCRFTAPVNEPSGRKATPAGERKCLQDRSKGQLPYRKYGVCCRPPAVPLLAKHVSVVIVPLFCAAASASGM